MVQEIVRTDIRKLSKEDLITALEEMGEKKFRAKQIYQWLWEKGAHSFEEMTNLSKPLRDKLQQYFIINAITLDKMQKSSDGTIKSRFKLHDGHLIESVLIPVPGDNRFTVCVSSQVGCSLTCKFCATGRMKRLRNLDASEIYDQVHLVNKQAEEHFGHQLTNIVYMGMGEPLLAYKNVLESIDKISSPEGMGMSPRRITVSTAGIAKMIKKLADDQVRFNLALSLHAADDTKRDEIMPINEQNNLEILMDSLQYFHTNTGNKISYEYISFQNYNDSIDDARRLAKLCTDFPVKINIIEYNPIDGSEFSRSDAKKVDAFASYLRKKGIMVTVRKSRGRDIDAACGQLANKE
ncbi:MAG: 23S rRNA (adenine(2503)-C(2))-methyltransferase RlmN [Saprospiraceae bacterium]|nr:23S rRNA (adenine(2503)-C(2))-methyltransferase RlmN [Saprospiraceae bacterium]